MNAQDKYRNKLFSVLGDSISTLDGYSLPADAAFYTGMQKFRADVFTPQDTWWGQVIARLGGALLVNHSISGSMVSRHHSCTVPSYGCSDARVAALGGEGESPDVIMIFMGINDWGCGVAPTPDDTANGGDEAIFSVAYQRMLEKLRDRYPRAEIWCLTLPVSAWRANADFAFPYCYAGRHIEAYCAVIRICAKAYGCRLIELHEPSAPYDTVDGFHPNAEGMKTLADAVMAQL